MSDLASRTPAEPPPNRNLYASLIIGLLVALGGISTALIASPPPTSPPIPLTGDRVLIDGSSTVFPITAAWAGRFNNEGRQAVVAFSGTGVGFQRFCGGETDLNDASRRITPSEEQLCLANGISGIVEFAVAYDGVSIVVPGGNSFANSLTVRELCRIWTSNASSGACGGACPGVTRWDQLNASWPAEAIQLFGPGIDSGTFDYFREVILAPFSAGAREDFIRSEDQNVILQGVRNEPYALGYLGYAFAVANPGDVRLLAIDDEDPDSNRDSVPDAGPTGPSEQTIRDGSYAPLTRLLFIYAHRISPAQLRQSLSLGIVRDFLRFGYSDLGQDLTASRAYVLLSAAEVAVQVAKIQP